MGILASTHTLGGILNPSDAVMTVGGVHTLIQQWQVQFTQNTKPIFEVGGTTTWFAHEPPQGSMSVGRLLVQDALASPFSGCQALGADITAPADCSGGATLHITDLVLQSASYSGQAQQAQVMENCSFVFTDLSV